MTALVDVNWLYQHMDDPTVKILDASIPKADSDETHLTHNNQIQGALFFDLKGAFSDKHNSLPSMMPSAEQFARECGKLGLKNSDTIVIYDHHGVYSSPRVWWMFKSMGHKNVFVLNGGLPEWEHASFPTEEKKERLPTLTQYTATCVNHFFTVKDQILPLLNHNHSKLLDARAKHRFLGIAKEPREGVKSGHIPRAINIPYTNVLDGFQLKSIKKLNDVFSFLKEKDTYIITSCGSGISACVLLLALNEIGFTRLSLYDGSWAEWGCDSNYPVETCKPFIKQLETQDLSALVSIAKQTFYETFASSNSKEDMHQYLNTAFHPEKLLSEMLHPNTLFFGIFLNSELVGYLKLNEADAQTEQCIENSMEIERIYILKEYIGYGFGKLLFNLALEKGKQAYKSALWLGVWEKNERAIQFYQNLGFVAFNTHTFCVGSDVQTDLLMKLELQPL